MKKTYNFQNAYRRLCRICGVLTQSQVAGVMGCSQASVAGFIKREKMPDSWLMKMTLKYNINPRWLLWGDEHKMFLSPTDKDPGNEENGNYESGCGGEGYVVYPQRISDSSSHLPEVPKIPLQRRYSGRSSGA